MLVPPEKGGPPASGGQSRRSGRAFEKRGGARLRDRAGGKKLQAMKACHGIRRGQGQRAQGTIRVHVAIARTIGMVIVHRTVVVMVMPGLFPVQQRVCDTLAAVVHEAARSHDQPVMQQRKNQDRNGERFAHELEDSMVPARLDRTW